MFLYRVSDLVLPLGYREEALLKALAAALGVQAQKIGRYKLYKRSLDARKKPILRYVITADVSMPEKIRRGDKRVRPLREEPYRLPPGSPVLPERPVVVGFGPAGIFAALILAEAGRRPIVLERGSRLEERQKKVEAFWQSRVLDESCNVQFGEGGAGAFSDGKLGTGVRDPRIRKVLETLAEAGAPEEILWEAKPHVGTDRLPGAVRGVREKIIALGGEIYFDTQMTGLLVKNGAVAGVRAARGGETLEFAAGQVLLCVGHSARDTFRLLEGMGLPMEPKAFSLGARIEHPAALIDIAQYGAERDKISGGKGLCAADYKLSARLPGGRGVYTFCMCPGGTVVGAASQAGMVVTNGMSAFARDGENSNSALLVGIGPADFGGEGPLAGVALQEKLERAAYRMAGENYNAPAQRLEDFLAKRESKAFGGVKPSYAPGVTPCDLNRLLPDFVCAAMGAGVREMALRLKGFDLGDAVLTGPETRSSSPLRLLRGENRQSPGLTGLYPCGEGAGYAGGIVSAAVDGIRTAEAVLGACP